MKAEAYKKYGDAALVSMVLEVLPHLAGEVRALITTKVYNVKQIRQHLRNLSLCKKVAFQIHKALFQDMKCLNQKCPGSEPIGEDKGDCSSRRCSTGEEPSS